MLLLDRAFETARKKNYKIVFPEKDDQESPRRAPGAEKETLSPMKWEGTAESRGPQSPKP